MTKRGTFPRLLVHGGAGTWKEKDFEMALAGVQAAVELGWELLHNGVPALEVVEKTVMVLEDRPPFDAGYGSYLNQRGEVEMDALICDGRKIDFGAVAGVRYSKNPVVLARHVLTKTDHRFIAGVGADQLAIELGLPQIPNLSLVTDEQFAAFQGRHERQSAGETVPTGTVGAVVMDEIGNLAAATSTGGTPNKRLGRIGDSPIFGAGGYADNDRGAISATGHGETIMRFLLSKYAIDLLGRDLTAQAAVGESIRYLERFVDQPEVGLIIVDRHGNLGAAHSTPQMPIAWVNQAGEIERALQAPDLLD
jgi:beta-aspartyl-peptidase (threonine type)